MRFAMLRNYLAFLRSHGVRWGDNTREVLWCGLSKVSERRGRDVREREQKRERERERHWQRESERACATGAHLARKLLSCFFGRTVVDISVGGLIPTAVVSCNVRVRSPIEKTDDHLLLLLLLDRNPMKLLRNTRPVRHFTSLHSLKPWKPASNESEIKKKQREIGR